MTPDGWNKLAERCEAAKGADREIDFHQDPRPNYAKETEAAAILAKETFSYDPNTGKLTWLKPHSMRGAYIGKEAGWVTGHGYKEIRFMGRSFKCHRIAWAIHYGCWPNGIIDHINGEKADNRIANLREASGSLNAFNKAIQAATTGRCVGMRNGKYFARINRNGSGIWLGVYRTEAEAKAAYQGAAMALYGNNNTRAMAAREGNAPA
jgi:hypothetical protein